MVLRGIYANYLWLFANSSKQRLVEYETWKKIFDSELRTNSELRKNSTRAEKRDRKASWTYLWKSFLKRQVRVLTDWVVKW